MSAGSFAGAVICGFSVLMLAGCAKTAAPPPPLPSTVPFTGKVLLDGKPLGNAVVTFASVTQGKGAYNPSGITNEEGKYELQTGTKQASKTGAVPGKYKVTVNRVAPPPNPKEPVAVMSLALPARYSDSFMTELTATVPDAGGTKDFELKSK